MQTRRLWSAEEDEAIQSLVKKVGTKKWSQISILMKNQFGLSGRSGKQCRQRWHNHLAPDLNKHPWSVQEQTKLFQAHLKLGNKWTQISKVVLGRTDNAIKNHFYSSVRRSLRRIGKIIGTKNSTNEIRTLKPVVLSSMFKVYDRNSSSAPEELKNLPSALFAFSQKKSNRKTEIDEEERQNLQNLIQKLKEFNDEYEKNRSSFKNTNNSEQEDDCSSSEEPEEKELHIKMEFGLKMEQKNENAPSLQLQIQEKQENIEEGRMNLDESVYEWAKFQSKCDLVRNYLLSQPSLCKSEENLYAGDRL